MSFYKKYQRVLRKHTGYRATWMPSVQMKVGDIGVIEKDGTFTRHTNLSNLGIPFEEYVDPEPSDDFSFQTAGVGNVSFKTAGDLDEKFKYVAKAKAGILVEFSGKDAVLMQTKGMHMTRVNSLPDLDKRMLELVKPGADEKPRIWEPEWTVITEVASAEVATILASTESGATIEIEAEGKLGPTGLLDASAGLSTKNYREVAVREVAKRGLTPLYKGRRIRAKWLGLWGPQQVKAHFAAQPSPKGPFGKDDFELVELSDLDLLDLSSDDLFEEDVPVENGEN